MFYNFKIYDAARSNVSVYATYFVASRTLVCVVYVGEDSSQRGEGDHGVATRVDVLTFADHRTPEQVCHYLHWKFNTEYVFEAGEKS